MVAQLMAECLVDVCYWGREDVFDYVSRKPANYEPAKATKLDSQAASLVSGSLLTDSAIKLWQRLVFQDDGTSLAGALPEMRAVARAIRSQFDHSSRQVQPQQPFPEAD
jgi:hypothetical protein